MERMEQLASLAVETMRVSLAMETKDILVALKQNNQQIIDSIKNAIQTVLCEAACQQKTGSKGPVAYISFSFMQSNLLLNHYALRLDAWDKRFMLDDNEATTEWNFHTILPCTGPNMKAVAKKLRGTMIRVQEYELKELERTYCLIYFTIATDILKSALSSSMEAMKHSAAHLDPEVQFTIGAYMEQQQLIYTWRRDE